MNKSVLILKSSPRARSNSGYLADKVAEGARESGATVEVIHLNQLNIHPCCACDLCRKLDGECAVNDDMQLVYPKLLSADAIVMASPIYWFMFSAQLKLCIDRLYALNFVQGHGLKGKNLGIVLTYGDDDLITSGAINAIHTIESIARYIGLYIISIIHGTANNPGDILKQPALMDQAFRLGRDLITHTKEDDVSGT